MKKKIIGILVCMLLIAATASSVASTQMSASISSVAETEIVDENAGSPCESAPCGLANTGTILELVDYQLQKTGIGGVQSRGVPFYGYAAYDPSGQLVEGPVKFDPSTPGTIIQLAPTTSSDFISGGTWAAGTWYGCEWGYYGNSNIWTIDNETGAMTLIGSYDPTGTGLSFNGLAYDSTSGTMYGCSGTDLYTVNMATGASTWVGSFGIYPDCTMAGIAFDDTGNLYGDELFTDSLYQINLSTGIATLIGPLGINLNFAQDMAYDNDTDILYLSAYTTQGELYTCNVITGAATLVGAFQGGAEITGFAIPYGEVTDTTPPEITNIEANPNPQTTGGSVNITCDVTDDTAVDEVWVNITYPDATSQNFSMIEGSYYFKQTYTEIGTYNYFIWANDTSGNSNISTIYTFKIQEEPDITPPVTTHSFDPATPDGDNGWYVSNVTITFTSTDDMSGVASTKYSLDNGVTWTTYTGAWPFDVIVGDFKHQLLYYSADNAGNVEPTNGPFDFKVDTTKPESFFYSFPIVFGPFIVCILNFGLVRDVCSGLDRVDFYVNGVFHHQIDLSSWPVGIWRAFHWFYSGPSGDKCTAIVYDKAGSWEEMKPQIVQVPQFRNGIKTNTDNLVRDMQEVQILENQMCVR